METTTNKLNAKDFIFIGIFGTVALLIFFVTGAIAALTLFGTVANIPITLFFVSIAFMLAASKVRKTGVFFIMGIIIVLPGFMAANGIGVGLSIIGWFIAETLASTMKYKDKKAIILSYMLGSTLQTALFTLPMYLSHGEYFVQRKEILHLTDEALQQYLQVVGSWQMYGSMVALTVITSFAGAWISMRILKKYFEKAGVI
ncbi:MptD family putative ECF transporter S component [Treponema sp. OMZ 855]|uniref:MptD family putative ECF transporter S component n=1 Tax=Treponema sp. OMZ 855 TaxID=1643512 RepID=UPI0020A5DD3B|nr:MptD family putative ECF transporter S component [Treponema sp. OMZ 855]UTC50718.1 MptD family putative ECF transporter S component [Treponema sp. OMZ 855]